LMPLSTASTTLLVQRNRPECINARRVTSGFHWDRSASTES
jgi:hypothetical protein